MKRPFLILGATMLASLFFLNGVTNQAMRVVFWATFVAFGFSLAHEDARKDKTLPTACLAVLLSICLFGGTQAKQQKAYQTDTKAPCYVQAVLCNLPYTQNGRFYYPLSTEFINGKPRHEKLCLVSNADLELSAHDTLKAPLTLKPMQDKLQKQLFTGQSCEYLYRATLSSDYTKEENTRHTPFSYLLAFRARCADALVKHLPQPESGVLLAMLFGTKHSLSPTVYRAFCAAGVSHLLVVSGLHFTTFTGLLASFLQALHLHRKQKAAIILACLSAMFVIMGGAPSVRRAAFMIALLFAGELLNREADSFNSVGFALVCILFAQPNLARSVSLLLSTFATLGILVLAKPLRERLLQVCMRFQKKETVPSALSFVLDVLCVTTAVTVFTFPIQLFSIGTFSVFALLGNFLLVTPAALLLLLGFFAAVFSAFPLPALGMTFRIPTFWLTKYFIWVATKIAALPHALLPISGRASKVVLGIAFLFAAVLCLCKIQKSAIQKSLIYATVFAFLLVNLGGYWVQEQRLQIVPMQNKTDSAILLHYKQHNILFFDVASPYAERNVCAILYGYSIQKLDAVILPHPSTKVFAEYQKLEASFPTGILYYPKAEANGALQTFAEKRPIEKEILPFAGGAMTVQLHMENGANYAQVFFGNFSARFSFSSENQFKGSSATLFWSAGELPKGFHPQGYQTIILGTKTKEADALALLNPELYTLYTYPNLAVAAKSNGTAELFLRR